MKIVKIYNSLISTKMGNINKFTFETYNTIEINAIIKIQRCFRKMLKHFNYFISNVNLMYKYYIFKYPIEYLLKYPEFLVNKTISNIDRKNEIEKWIKTNLNENSNKRTRYDIFKFFKLNNITIGEITYTGW
jgi:hypothetical protein